MSTSTKYYDWTDYEDCAREAAGNHEKFDSFAWDGPADGDDGDWCIVYTHNRDSGTIDRANAETIATIMAEHIESGDCNEEHHGHWACGWVDGYSIRVWRDGEVSAAFKAWCDIQAQLADYPVLDDEALSRIESEELDDSWDNWIRREFERELESAYGVELSASSDELREVFDAACSEASEYPEHNGDGVSVCIERIVEAVTDEQVKPFAPIIGIKVYRNGLFFCNGQLHLNDYTCDSAIDGDTFFAVMCARDLEMEYAEIDGARFTWESN